MAPECQLYQPDDTPGLQCLELIDQLLALGLTADISLPILVVVGDQSSGKSSLLEGLSGLPFPVAPQLCTRFATQVSFRRSTEELIMASLIPAHDATCEHKRKLAGFNETVSVLSSEIFTDLIKKASSFMGLDPTGTTAGAKRFSADVLKFVICGKSQQNLTIVDVPGLYHNPTQEQTLEDLGIIRDLIRSYAVDPRTIIMAVLDARNNLANQEVFSIARQVDPDGMRTLGVMTKLDAIQSGDEYEALRIAKNHAQQLAHGWFCVRNRTTSEIARGVTIAQRHENEQAFFKTEPWDSLEKSRIGVDSLKQSLGKLLSKHITAELPNIYAEIKAKLEDSKAQLDELGASRLSAREQAQYLTRLVTKYEQLVNDAIGHDSIVKPAPTPRAGKRTSTPSTPPHDEFDNPAVYNTVDRLALESVCAEDETVCRSSKSASKVAKKRSYVTNEDPPAKEESVSRSSQSAWELRKNTVRTLKEFDSAMQDGQHIAFKNATQSYEVKSTVEPTVFVDDEEEDAETITLTPSRKRKHLQHMPCTPSKKSKKSENISPDIYSLIKSVWDRCRGTDLSGNKDLAVKELFQMQTQSWSNISSEYVQKVMLLLNDMHQNFLVQVFDEEPTRERVRDAIATDMATELAAAEGTLGRILDEERNCKLSKSLEFDKKLSTARKGRMQKALTSMGYSDGQSTRLNFKNFAEHLMADGGPMSEEIRAIHDIHDMLKAYYEIAIERYKGALQREVIEASTLGKHCPLKVLNYTWVANLSDEHLAYIAGEERHIVEKRKTLQTQVARLEKAQEICASQGLAVKTDGALDEQ